MLAEVFIEQRYDVDSTDATLAGYSLGGLFAAYAMLCRRGLFRRSIIGSPSVWWDGEVLLKFEEAYAAEHTDLAARIFLSMGELETPRMLSGMRTLAQRLRSHDYHSLALSDRIMEGETHASGKAAALIRGVGSVFSS